MLAAEAYRQNRIMLNKNRMRQYREAALLSSIPKKKKRDMIISYVGSRLIVAVIMAIIIGAMVARWLR